MKSLRTTVISITLKITISQLFWSRVNIFTRINNAKIGLADNYGGSNPASISAPPIPFRGFDRFSHCLDFMRVWRRAMLVQRGVFVFPIVRRAAPVGNLTIEWSILGHCTRGLE